MHEQEKKVQAIDSLNLLSQLGTRFVVSQVHNRFFVELFPHKKQSNRQEALHTSNPQTPIPEPTIPDPPIPSPETPTQNSSTPDPEPPNPNPSTSDSELSIPNLPNPDPKLPNPNSKKARENVRKRKILLKRKPKHKCMKNQTPEVDVLIITALSKERDALIKCENLPGSPNNGWEKKYDSLDRLYYWRSFERGDGTSFNVAAASASKMGEQATTGTATRLVTYLKPRCLAMVGICAGNRRDGNICMEKREDGNQEENVRLGDIIIADRVFDFEFGKLKVYYDNRKGREENIFHDLTTYNLRAKWGDRINNLSQLPIEWISSITSKRPKSDEHQENWLLHRLYNYKVEGRTGENPKNHLGREKECPNWDKIIQRLWENNLLVNGKLELTNDGKDLVKSDKLLEIEERDPADPRIHFGPIGTSKKVIRDLKIFDYLKKTNCRVLGIEMEGNAIGAVAEDFEIPMIVVKGVADYADHSKNNQFHQYAAEASARFLIAFLKEHLPPA